MAFISTDKFNFATVMRPKFYNYETDALICELDSLRISNITQEGPTKTTKGGLYGEVMMKYGKTMKLEMEDVIGRVDVLTGLMGANLTAGSTTTQIDAFAISGIVGTQELELKYDVASGTPVVTAFLAGGDELLTVSTHYTITNSVVTLNLTAIKSSFAAAVAGDLVKVSYVRSSGGGIEITDKFAPAMKIIGDTFVIDATTGAKRWTKITIHKFIPDSIFNLNMEVEGDFAVTTINGDIMPNTCGVFFVISEDGTDPCGA